MKAPCPAGCGGTSGDGGLCASCTCALRAMLDATPGAAAQLRITVARQAKSSRGDGVPTRGSGSAQPLPYNPDAAGVAADLRRTLQDAAIRHGHPATHGGATLVWIPPARAAAWLTEHLHEVRMSQWARLTLDQVSDLLDATLDVDTQLARGAVWRRVDRSPDRWFAGICGEPLGAYECTEDLMATPGAAFVRCPGCGTQHDVERRRAELRAAVRMILGTTAWLARALSPLVGEPIDPDKISVWKSRGRIVPHGTDPDGRPLYLAGDVMDLALANPRRKVRA